MTNILTIIEAFTQSLTRTQSVEEVCWALTKNVIAHLDFLDCVVYLFDERRDTLIQVAAHGPKNPIDLDILNPITIKPGEGIVGATYQTGESILIKDTSSDDRYILDDAMRLSELAVPIMNQGKAIGVIDSEHPDKDFYTEDHRLILQTMAAITSNKIVKTRAFIDLEKLNERIFLQQIETKLQNDELAELNDQLDELVYRLSHDIRTPIISLLGLMDFMKNGDSPPETIVPMAEKSLMKLEWMLANIYFYSDNKRRDLENKKIDLKLLLKSVINKVIHERKNDLKWNVEIDDVDHFMSDPWRMQVVLMNLIHNTLTFAKEKGEVNVRIQLLNQRSKWILHYYDDGKGLPNSYSFDAQRMFNRGDEESKGAGFGFFLCNEVAKSMNAQFLLPRSKVKIFHAVFHIPKSNLS